MTVGVSMKYARLFALLMRMRQTCCHPFLVLGNGSKKVVHPVATANNGQQQRNLEGLIHIHNHRIYSKTGNDLLIGRVNINGN